MDTEPLIRTETWRDESIDYCLGKSEFHRRLFQWGLRAEGSSAQVASGRQCELVELGVGEFGAVNKVKGSIFGDLTAKRTQPVVRTRYHRNRIKLKVCIAITSYASSEGLCSRG